MARVLVVYHSRDGHTRQLAQEIAQACAADVEELRLAHGGAGPTSYLRCVFDAVLHRRPAIVPPSQVLRPDDLLVVGTPVWAGNVAGPVRSYLHVHGATADRVAFFCTFGGSGQQKVLRDLAALCQREPVATLALTDQQCALGEHRDELAQFVRRLGPGSATVHAMTNDGLRPSRS